MGLKLLTKFPASNKAAVFLLLTMTQRKSSINCNLDYRFCIWGIFLEILLLDYWKKSKIENRRTILTLFFQMLSLNLFYGITIVSSSPLSAWGKWISKKTAIWEGITIFAVRRGGFTLGEAFVWEVQRFFLKMFVFMILWSSVKDYQIIINETKHSRMDEVTFVEDSL